MIAPFEPEPRPRTEVRSSNVRARSLDGSRVSRLTAVSTTVAIAAAALAAAALGTSVSAQDGTDIGPAVEIRGGTCEQPGDVTALLEALDVPPEAGGTPHVAVSLTDVMQPFSDLTAQPQVIVADASAIGGGQVCGSLGGQAADERGLAVLLTDEEGSFAGVAWLSELGLEATSVDVFVIEGSSVPDAGLPADGSPAPASPGPSGSPGPSASASPAPSASPGPDGVAPGEEIDPSEDIDVDVGD